MCRHSFCDLHTTTNILLTPLASKCSQPFKPAGKNATAEPASALCCTTDITLAEYKSLCAKMDSSDPTATTPEAYQKGVPFFRTELYNGCATMMSHDDYVVRGVSTMLLHTSFASLRHAPATSLSAVCFRCCLVSVYGMTHVWESADT